MRRLVLVALAVLVPAAALPAAAGTRMLLVARDLDERPLSGFSFAYGGVQSLATTQAGATELDLPPEHTPGRQIKVQLVLSAKQAEEEWFLVNPQVNVPTGPEPAEVVLMRRSTFRQFAAEARDAPRQTPLGPGEPTEEDRKRALVEAAAHFGLTREQVETAVPSFAETQDPKDQGIAAYFKGQYSQAEELLKRAAENKESDCGQTLPYLGASQYEQAKYRAAAETFRKSVALCGEDPKLLNWLGRTLIKLAEWNEAEPPLRRALAIDEKRLGMEHPSVAIRLNNLVQVLQATNRLAQAEPLMRRALAIDEKSFGADHSNVARDLNNLALLLQDTNRLAEAEPLMRRALTIAEKSFGTDHPNVATTLNNLATLLKATNRLAEAEPLMRRALAIDEKSFGTDHPNVAIRLNNLGQLLQATNRLPEAEPLMRRALAITEKSFGPDHPHFAIALNNLALLLQATNRLAEAEPLLRRALVIDEKSFGPSHPNVAIRLNNLAALLQGTNRFAEAEPLMRRALAILLEFKRRTGHEHPYRRIVAGNYRALLHEMGRSDAEIEADIKALVGSPN